MVQALLDRQDDHRGLGVLAHDLEQRQQHLGRATAVDGLHDARAERQGGELALPGGGARSRHHREHLARRC